MNDAKVLITQEGFEKLKTELEYLKTQKRAEVSEKIRIARGFGDLSENAEYDEAKNEQVKVEARIAELELQVKNAQIIEDVKDKKEKTVSIGDTVKLMELSKEKELTVKIVGTVEADILKSKISNESPVGKAIIGKHKGETVEVITNKGTLKYKILEIVR